jgi:beta-1,4-N-acetylglucosaminyltransferase
MIFLTVGTAFPFDRLVKAVDDLASQGKIDTEIYGQVGIGGYTPKNFESVETLDKKKFDTFFGNADAVIAHAGMGTITTALSQLKPILVVPRLKKYGELVNDHQNATARRFEELGHVIAAYDEHDLADKISALKDFKPVPRESQAASVSQRIGEFLRQCQQ